jgi:hypothetical protein
MLSGVVSVVALRKNSDRCEFFPPSARAQARSARVRAGAFEGMNLAFAIGGANHETNA